METTITQRERKHLGKEKMAFLEEAAKKLSRSVYNQPATLAELCFKKIYNRALKLQDYGPIENEASIVKAKAQTAYKQKHAVTFLKLFRELCKPEITNCQSPHFCMICSLGRYFIVQKKNNLSIFLLDAGFSCIDTVAGEFWGITDDSRYVLISTQACSFLLELPSLEIILLKEPFQPQDDALILHENRTHTLLKNFIKYVRIPSINGSHPHAEEIEMLLHELASKLGSDDYLFGSVFFGGRSYIARRAKYNFNDPWFRAEELMGRNLDAIPSIYLTGPNSLVDKVLRSYIDGKGFSAYCGNVTNDARYGILGGVNVDNGDITRDGRAYSNLIIRVDFAQIGTPQEMKAFEYISPGHIEDIEISPDGNLALVLINANPRETHHYLTSLNKEQSTEEDTDTNFKPLKTEEERKAFKAKHFAETKVLLFDLNTGNHHVLLEKQPIVFMHFYFQGGGFYIWDGSNNFYNYNLEKMLATLKLSQLVRILEFEKMARAVDEKRFLDEEEQQKLLGFIERIHNPDIGLVLQQRFNL